MVRNSLIILILFFTATSYSQFYQTQDMEIVFFSSAPVEDIEAESDKAIAVFNAANGEISIKVKMRSFNFDKALMQEHFNENYVESERFPEASFRAKILDFQGLKNGSSTALILEGDLTVHGVTNKRKIPLTMKLSKDGDEIELSSKFIISCKDHRIKIPKLLWNNIAENIEVTVNANLQKI